MILQVSPSDSLRGSIKLPPSKSYSIRAFIIASCGGNSRIINPSDCDDAKVAMRVARQCGAQITCQKKDIWKIISKKRKQPTAINVGESGTVLRFILPLVAMRGSKVDVISEGTLRRRPNTHLVRTLKAMGSRISGRGLQHLTPISVCGGSLSGGRVLIDGSLSSQFISSLLIACPQIDSDTRLTITGKKIVSQTYITMTQQILKRAGVTIKKTGSRSFVINGKQTFKGLKNFTVPSDYGLAAFFLAAGALTKSKIKLNGYLKDNFVQADGKIVHLLRKMGVRIHKTDSCMMVSGPYNLKGGSFSLQDCPDLVPIMSIVALFARGKTRLYGIKHVRAKESNRISDLRKELIKIGACVQEKEDELIIVPQENYKRNVVLNPHRDHRLVMAFCVLGLKLGTKICDIECVSKSYPRFVKDFKSIGAHAVGRHR